MKASFKVAVIFKDEVSAVTITDWIDKNVDKKKFTNIIQSDNISYMLNQNDEYLSSFILRYDEEQDRDDAKDAIIDKLNTLNLNNFVESIIIKEHICSHDGSGGPCQETDVYQWP